MAAVAAKNKQKRPASIQTGPKAKKTHVEKPEVSKGKKRSQPVTGPLMRRDDDESSTDEALEDEEEADIALGQDAEMDGTSHATKDPNGMYAKCSPSRESC